MNAFGLSEVIARVHVCSSQKLTGNRTGFRAIEREGDIGILMRIGIDQADVDRPVGPPCRGNVDGTLSVPKP